MDIVRIRSPISNGTSEPMLKLGLLALVLLVLVLFTS